MASSTTAQQRNDDGDGGDDGGLEVLQEEEHYKDDEDDGYDERLDHIADGSIEEVIACLEFHKLQTCRHHRLHVLVKLVDAGIYLSGIGTGCLEHHEDGAWLAVDVRKEVVAHGTDLHISHIAQMQQVAALAGSQYDLVELFDGLQRTLVFHGVLVAVLRLCTQATRGGHKALATDGCEHVVGFQTVLCHYVGLHPDAQRIGVA